jgi:hypothetical protein
LNKMETMTRIDPENFEETEIPMDIPEILIANVQDAIKQSNFRFTEPIAIKDDTLIIGALLKREVGEKMEFHYKITIEKIYAQN